MSKRIASYEELLKKAQECESKIAIRKKWSNCAVGSNIKVEIKIGANLNSLEAINRCSQVIESVTKCLQEVQIEGVAVYETRFQFNGENPAMEVVLPGIGQMVFRNLDEAAAVDIIKRHLSDLEKFEKVILSLGNETHCNH